MNSETMEFGEGEVPDYAGVFAGGIEKNSS
jgi:hypothetical protein